MDPMLEEHRRWTATLNDLLPLIAFAVAGSLIAIMRFDLRQAGVTGWLILFVRSTLFAFVLGFWLMEKDLSRGELFALVAGFAFAADSLLLIAAKLLDEATGDPRGTMNRIIAWVFRRQPPSP